FASRRRPSAFRRNRASFSVHQAEAFCFASQYSRLSRTFSTPPFRQPFVPTVVLRSSSDDASVRR
ncbi:hypothetical protein Csa_023822, partial [Cucumis sativus]